MDNKTIRDLQKGVASYQAYVTNGSFSPGNPNPCTMTETINNAQISGNNRYTIPSLRPYGFYSVAPSGTVAIVQNMGVGQRLPTVIGHAYVYKPDTLASAAEGESGIHSKNFFFEMKNTGILYKWLEFTATPISGENTNLIFNDILTALIALTTSYNDLVAAYNAHQHSVPNISGGTDTAESDTTSDPATPVIPDPNLNTDQVAVQTGTTLINTGGISPIRTS